MGRSIATIAWFSAFCACAPAVGPSRVEEPRPPSPVVTPLRPRWMHANRQASIGPAVAGGTLVLLGGRRALLEPDGRLRPETTPAAEALTGFAAVPTSRGVVYLGIAPRKVYRFVDPLGPGVPIVDAWLEPMFVSGVRDGAVDLTLLTSGDTKTFDPWTGAALGGCWSTGRDKCPTPPHDPPDEHRPPLPARAPPLLRWIDATGVDPLALAVTDGARLDDRTAVVAARGLVAMVDLETGGVRQLAAYQEKRPAKTGRANDGYGPCEVAHAGSEVWFFCPWTGVAAGPEGFDTMALGVLRVRGGSALTVKADRAFASYGRDAGHGLVRSSSAGGVLVTVPCDFESREAIITRICVRQRDGAFSTFIGAVEARTSYALPAKSEWIPLGDGKLARVVGGATASGEPLRVEALGPTGEVTPFPPFGIGGGADDFVEVAGIDEKGGDLLIGLAGRHGNNLSGWIVRQPLAGGGATAREIAGASRVGVGGGHVLALIEPEKAARVVISNDGGATVFEEPAPGNVYGVSRVLANDVGAYLDAGYGGDDWLRIGWERQEP